MPYGLAGVLTNMVFIEFFTGGLLWFLSAHLLTKDWDSKSLKTELIRFSPAIVYGVYFMASAGNIVTYKSEGTFFLLALILDLVTLPVSTLMGIFVVPTHLGNYVLSNAGFSELYEWNFIEVGFFLHFQNS